MNYKNLINELKQKTGADNEMCTNIVNAYEEYCAKESKLPFTKEVDETMVNYIAQSTNCSKDKIKEIVTALVSIVRKEVKHKIPFLK